MKPVFQTEVDKGRGDCMRAAIASLLEFEASMVPNFRLFDDHLWHNVYTGFLWNVGWDFNGSGYVGRRELLEEDSFSGFFYAIVASKNFADVTHAVVIDLDGVVVHDPTISENSYIGENVLENGALKSWHLVVKRKDGSWKSWNK